MASAYGRASLPQGREVDDFVSGRCLCLVDLVVGEVESALAVLRLDELDRLAVTLVDVERALAVLERDAVDAVDLLLLARGVPQLLEQLLLGCEICDLAEVLVVRVDQHPLATDLLPELRRGTCR